MLGYRCRAKGERKKGKGSCLLPDGGLGESGDEGER